MHYSEVNPDSGEESLNLSGKRSWNTVLLDGDDRCKCSRFGRCNESIWHFRLKEELSYPGAAVFLDFLQIVSKDKIRKVDFKYDKSNYAWMQWKNGTDDHGDARDDPYLNVAGIDLYEDQK